MKVMYYYLATELPGNSFFGVQNSRTSEGKFFQNIFDTNVKVTNVYLVLFYIVQVNIFFFIFNQLVAHLWIEFLLTCSHYCRVCDQPGLQ